MIYFKRLNVKYGKKRAEPLVLMDTPGLHYDILPTCGFDSSFIFSF